MAYDPEDADADTSSIEHGGSEPRDGWNQSRPPSVAIVQAVAEATGREHTTMPSLCHAVDPDALDALLTRGLQQDGHVHVSFTYDGVPVSVRSDGTLLVRTDGTTHEPPTAPETSADLETTLEELLRTAYRNGVSITGGYGVRNGPAFPDWDIHITQVEKPSDDDS